MFLFFFFFFSSGNRATSFPLLASVSSHQAMVLVPFLLKIRDVVA